MASPSDSISMALFCDFENVALGVRDAQYEKFDIKPILERLLLKGSIVVKKAYCDWERYKGFKATMHEANFELIEIPHVRQSGKNSADIRLVVDALDLCYTKSHVNTFVIISGDSDFSPLVSKLRENAKQVIGVGVKQSTSDLLIANCDEFIFYDDLVRENQRAQARRQSPGNNPPAPRRNPDFSESYYGFRTFGNLLEEAQARGLLEFGRDEKSGAYVYRGHGGATARPDPVGRLDAPMERSGGAGYFRHDFHAVAVAPEAAPGGSEGGTRGGRSRGRRQDAPADERVEPRSEPRGDAPTERPAGGYFRPQAPAVAPAEAAAGDGASTEGEGSMGAAVGEPVAVAGAEPAVAAPAPRSRRTASAARRPGGRKAAAAEDNPARSESGAPLGDSAAEAPPAAAAPAQAAASRPRKPRNTKPVE